MKLCNKYFLFGFLSVALGSCVVNNKTGEQQLASDFTVRRQTEQKKILLKSQQGELDAVPMYLRLSEVAKDEKLKSIFKICHTYFVHIDD